MAHVTLLSWNIETFGPSKFVDFKEESWQTNAQALTHMIVATAHAHRANMIVLYEVAPKYADFLASFLRKSFNKFYRGMQWKTWIVASNKRDKYLLLYREEQGFQPYCPGGTGAPLSGLVSKDIHGSNLKFHSRMTNSGGRKPAYFIFETTDRGAGHQICFSVVCYHAMFNKRQGSVGLASLAKGAELSQAPDGTALPSAIIAGDFNVDMETEADAYDDLDNLTPPAVPVIDPTALGAAARSSLKNVALSGTPTSLDYRVNAYDNILRRNAFASNAQVIDMISELCLSSSGALSPYTVHFDLEGVKHSEGISSLPPRTITEAWCFYRNAISNHLPVVATITI